MYLEEGAAADLTGGGGGHLVYMETASVVNLKSGSTGAGIFREQGAVIRINGVPTEPAPENPALPALDPSPLGALPQVLPLPVITSSPAASGKVAESFIYTVTTEERSPTGVQFAAAGLPAGLTLDASTGIITGTPQTAGVFAVTLSATSAYGTGTFALTLTIGTSLSPVFPNLGILSGKTSEPLSFILTASNSPDGFAATGLPEGLALDPITGAITGTPTTSGVFQVAVTATNANGAGSATWLLLVDRVQPQITGFSQPMAIRGDRVQVLGQGFTDTSTIYFTGSLNELIPAPFTVVSDVQVEVEIPQVVTQWFSNYESRMLVITPAGATVTVPPNFVSVQGSTTANAAKFFVVRNGGSLAGTGSGGVAAYLEPGATAQMNGGGGHTFFMQSGATLTLGGGGGGHLVVQAAGARITGNPRPKLVGVASLIASFPQALLRIFPTPKIISNLKADLFVGTSFTYQIRIETSLEPARTYAASGLPPGLAVDPNNGIISGVPTEIGTFLVQLSATNNFGAGVASATFTVSTPPVPLIATSGNFNTEVGLPFNLQIAASQSPTFYEAIGLPEGLTVNAGTGLISGTVIREGAYLILHVTNANGTAKATISLLVGRKPPRIFSMPESGPIGSTIEIQGEGFTETSAVRFAGATLQPAPATFEVVSDTVLHIVIPAVATSSLSNHKVRISIETPAGATVTIPPDFVSVEGNASASSSSYHVVQSGATLTSSGRGGILAFLKSGASSVINGGGGHTFFIEGGADLNLTGGAGAYIVAGTGSNVASTASYVQVPVVSPSYVASLLRVPPIPQVTSPGTAAASLGLPFIYTARSTNSPTLFEAAGLPPGLVMNPTNGIISGRVSGGEASYPVVLTVTNSEGVGTFALVMEVRDDYRTWKKDNFALLEGGAADPKAADSADPDGDGIANLLEFSAGLDPLYRDPGSFPLELVINGKTPQFRYRRIKGDGIGSTVAGYTVGTITYTLLASHDLAAWHTGADYFVEVGSPIDNADGTETVTVKPTGSDNQFVTLKVSHSSP